MDINRIELALRSYQEARQHLLNAICDEASDIEIFRASGRGTHEANDLETLPSGVERTLTRKEAARYLGVTPGTLNTWACTGAYRIPYKKVGRFAHYKIEDLDKFALSRRRGVPLQ